MRKINLLILVFFICACAAQKTKTLTASATQLKGDVLLFDEKRPGEPGGLVRMLVTEDFLRIDSGNATDDFLLFNRKTGVIDNVVVEDETIFSLARSIDLSQQKDKVLDWKITQEKSHVVTNRLGQNKSEFRRFFVNDVECRAVVSVPDLLPGAVQALREYHFALAKELSRGLQFQPADNDCYLAMNVAEPARFLQFGFPIREWDKKGYQRFLTDYKMGIIFPASVFQLPENFARYGSP